MKVKKKVSILFSVALFCGMATIGSEALALEIGDEITAAIPATPAMPAMPATLATPAVEAIDTDIASGFIVNSTLAKFGNAIAARKATQADVDASVLHNANFKNGDPVKIGETIGERIIVTNSVIVGETGATWADITAGAMIDSNSLTIDDIFANDGKYEQFVLSGFDTETGDDNGLLGSTVLERIAIEADVIANVISSGTIVTLGDEVFAGTIVELNSADEYRGSNGAIVTIDVNDIDSFGFLRTATQADVDATADNTGDNISFTLGDKILGDGAFVEIAYKNPAVGEVGEWIGERTAGDADVTEKVRGDDGELVTAGDEISARFATQNDKDAGAMIDSTVIEDGDLVFNGYADADDVDAKKTTGNVFVTEGDTILSRAATVEDIAAGVFTGGKLVAIDKLIPGAVIVTAADVEAGLEIDGVAVVAGDIIFLAKDAAGATEATPANPGSDAVLATANDVYEWVLSETPEAFKAELDEMSQNLSGMEKLTAISSIMEKDKAFIAAEKTVSIKDSATLMRTAFGLVPDAKAFDEYNTAVDEVIAGTMTVDEIRTKINPDVNSSTGSVFTGISAVSNSIGSHQMNLIASSGKYGTKKHLAGLDSGKNSGSSSMNTSTWMEGFISDSTMDMRDSVAGYNASTHGATFGIDTMLANDSILGFAFSYANIDVNGKSVANSQTDTDQFQGTVYGSVMQDVYFLNGSLSYAHGESDTSRTTFGGEAAGSYGTDIYSLELGAGMPIVNGDMTITPQTTIRYSAISTDAYTEDGNGALDVSVEDMNMLTLKTGVSFEDKIKLSEASIIPKMRLMVDWDILREKAVTTASWVSTGATIVPIDGPKPAAFGGSVGVGFDYATDNGLYVISLDYDMSAKPDYISHAGIAKLRMNF